MGRLSLAALSALLLIGCSYDRPASLDPSPVSAVSDSANQSLLGVKEAGLRPVPVVTAEILGGGTFEPAAMEGSVQLINFWATWCAPCVEEMPELNELHAELAARGLVVTGIATNELSAEGVVDFVRDHGIEYDIVIDGGAVQDAFGGIFGLPTTFLVDRHGRITSRIIGKIPFDTVRPVLEDMLASGPS